MKRHQCTLPPQEGIIVRYIDSGWFVDWRRKWREFLMVSDTNPCSRAFLKSGAAIRREKARHLQHYYYMIHPFSKGRAYWEFFMMFVFLSLLIIIPIEISSGHILLWLSTIKFIFDLLCCADICITFATGFYHPYTKKVILNKKLIALRYLKGYFIIDVISSFPLYYIMDFLGYSTGYTAWRLVTFLKFLRITTLLKYLDTLRLYCEFSIYRFSFFKIMLVYIIMVLWATSIMHMVALRSPNSWLPEAAKSNVLYGLFYSCFRATYTFLLIGYGFRLSNSYSDLLCTIIGLMIGLCLKLYFLAQVVQILHKYNSSANKYRQHMQQLNEYVRYKGLPETIKRRITRYFDFKFQKHFYRESEILGSITPQLRQDIIMHTCRRFVEKVDFFRDLPLSLLLKIVSCLKSTIFLPNDVIMQAGIAGDTMYFISYGTVAVYTIGGREICHLTDGSHFGEIAIMTENEKRVASVVAVDPCELFGLTRNDFQKAMESYPEYYLRMKRLAQDRLQRTQAVEIFYQDRPSQMFQMSFHHPPPS